MAFVEQQRLEIIAEAGSNHNSSVELACDLIDLAADAHSDYVKFQFIHAEQLYLDKIYKNGAYHSNPVFDRRKQEEMSFESWKKIFEYAAKRRITPFASVFDNEGINNLKALNSRIVKIASTDLVFHRLIVEATKHFERVIVSTGMATYDEVQNMLKAVMASGNIERIELMHCVSIYPCQLVDANLGRIEDLRRLTGLNIGYSDHTTTDISAIIALARGVNVFEKHITTDRSLPGFDHAHAMDREGFTRYVSNLKNAQKAIQQNSLENTPDECITKNRARRGLYAARNLIIGDTLTEDDIKVVRPSNCHDASEIADLVGKKVACSIKLNEPLCLENSEVRAGIHNDTADRFWTNEMKQKKIL